MTRDVGFVSSGVSQSIIILNKRGMSQLAIEGKATSALQKGHR